MHIIVNLSRITPCLFIYHRIYLDITDFWKILITPDGVKIEIFLPKVLRRVCCYLPTSRATSMFPAIVISVIMRYNGIMPAVKTIRSELFVNTVNNLSFAIDHHGYVVLDNSWRETDKHLQVNVLYFVKTGEGVYTVDGVDVPLTRNRAYLFPIGRNASFHTDDYLEKFFIHFRLTVNSLFDVFELFDITAYSRPVDASLFDSIERFSSNDLKDILAVRELLFTHILGFIGDAAKDTPEKLAIARKYEPMMTYIDSNLSVALSLEALAAVMNITPTYLSASFTRDTGRSIKRVIIERIVRRASRELTRADKKVRDVAHELGFKDEHYFSKFFKRETGVSPREFRL